MLISLFKRRTQARAGFSTVVCHLLFFLFLRRSVKSRLLRVELPSCVSCPSVNGARGSLYLIVYTYYQRYKYLYIDTFSLYFIAKSITQHCSVLHGTLQGPDAHLAFLRCVAPLRRRRPSQRSSQPVWLEVLALYGALNRSITVYNMYPGLLKVGVLVCYAMMVECEVCQRRFHFGSFGVAAKKQFAAVVST